MLIKHPIILASVSPRRQQILTEAGISFTIKSKQIPEIYPSSMDKYEIPVYLSKQKALSLKDDVTNEIIIAADTIVALNNEILEKPRDKEHAFQMLKKISANMHQVVTGVTLMYGEFIESFYDVTEVYFTTLSDEDINHYIDKYEPYDKAGSYGIQEYIGLVGIERINGSFYNVMGLPIHKVIASLKHINTLR